MSRSMRPQRAVERYLKERKPEVSESTYRNHKYALKRFVEWCDEAGLEDVTELDGFHIHDFKIHRRENGGVNEVTLYNNLCALRVFIRWMQSMDLVEVGLAENMILPNPDDDARNTKIEADTAEAILEYLEKFEYATLRHSLFALLWDTGFRLGTIRAIDLRDYYPKEQYVEIHHRPKTGTPLKNKQNAEREVNLHEWVCEILDDYIAIHREEVKDDEGRKPLLTTRYGRPAGTNLRQNINALTRPCHYSQDCPHNRDEINCEAAQNHDYAQRCPSSVPPHALRRSAITAWLNKGHSKELLSDRMNVSTKTLEKHYDARTKSEKRVLRREAFEMSRD
ncbi:site-specific integrase [Halostella sp. JP-L12]|uniref:tyrosine-type recombinase/integrase n=1 Tax=Halostella TaxID=1843185 RepID=UPI000EF77F36|nr:MULTISPECIES: site-specific integrase [Halostella]NHN48404.1 site-specific integrase [Halostella sp. JP-L12]